MTLIKLNDNLYIPENFEENHVYFADEEGKKKYTGITTVLGVLNKPALVPWAARMAVEYITTNEWTEWATNDICYVKKETLEEAKTAYAKKREDGAKKGTDTHALVEEYVNECIERNGGKPFFVSIHESIQVFVDWARKENITFISAETPLVSQKHWIAGTADLIFEKDGKRYIGDIKTYKKIWDRQPFYQCAGYAMMYEEMNTILVVSSEEQEWHNSDEFTNTKKIAGYCVINLPKERDFIEDADIMWSFDVEGDTRAFMACLEIYRQNAQFKAPKVPYKRKGDYK
jgi:hypothetical protein